MEHGHGDCHKGPCWRLINVNYIRNLPRKGALPKPRSSQKLTAQPLPFCDTWCLWPTPWSPVVFPRNQSLGNTTMPKLPSATCPSAGVSAEKSQDPPQFDDLPTYLVVGWPTPLKNHGVSSSVGMMTFPYMMESHKFPWFQTTQPDYMMEKSWFYRLVINALW